LILAITEQVMMTQIGDRPQIKAGNDVLSVLVGVQAELITAEPFMARPVLPTRAA